MSSIIGTTWTFFVQLAVPAGADDELTGSILGNFGASELGEAAETIELGGLSWEVFMPDGELAIVLARASSGDMTYILGIAATPDQVEALSESLLQPAVGAFTADA